MRCTFSILDTEGPCFVCAQSSQRPRRAAAARSYKGLGSDEEEDGDEGAGAGSGDEEDGGKVGEGKAEDLELPGAARTVRYGTTAM